jgi:hypothetical protein
MRVSRKTEKCNNQRGGGYSTGSLEASSLSAKC